MNTQERIEGFFAASLYWALQDIAGTSSAVRFAHDVENHSTEEFFDAYLLGVDDVAEIEAEALEYRIGDMVECESIEGFTTGEIVAGYSIGTGAWITAKRGFSGAAIDVGGSFLLRDETGLVRVNGWQGEVSRAELAA